MPAQTDPLTQVYEQILQTLAGFPPFAAAVKLNNRINLDDNAFVPKKDHVQSGDTPETRLEEGSILFDAFANSRDVSFEVAYPLQISTDSITFNKANRVLVYVCQALALSGAQIGLPSLVQKYRVTNDQSFSLYRQDANRGKIAWSTILTIRITLTMSRAQFTAIEY